MNTNCLIPTKLKLALVAGGLCLGLGAAAGVVAQTAQGDGSKSQTDSRVFIERQEVVKAPGGEGANISAPPGNYTFKFVSSEMSFDGKVVKGAPYSAETVTETVQTLADGNRIVRKNTGMVYRDSEGRTRREQSIGMVGPFAASGEAHKTFFINDPVSGSNYVLDPESHSARKQASRADMMALADELHKNLRQDMKVTTGHLPAGSGEVTEVHRQLGTGTSNIILMPGGGGTGGAMTVSTFSNSGSTEKKESLGKQNFDGIEAEGTRVTSTIPAGKIGNERAIDIVSEHWYSPELQTIVMSKRSDPMVGETTFQLTNISRTEPARSLFEVPADYKIEAGSPGNSIRIEKKIKQ